MGVAVALKGEVRHFSKYRKAAVAILKTETSPYCIIVLNALKYRQGDKWKWPFINRLIQIQLLPRLCKLRLGCQWAFIIRNVVKFQ